MFHKDNNLSTLFIIILWLDLTPQEDLIVKSQFDKYSQRKYDYDYTFGGSYPNINEYNMFYQI